MNYSNGSCDYSEVILVNPSVATSWWSCPGAKHWQYSNPRLGTIFHLGLWNLKEKKFQMEVQIIVKLFKYTIHLVLRKVSEQSVDQVCNQV